MQKVGKPDVDARTLVPESLSLIVNLCELPSRADRYLEWDAASSVRLSSRLSEELDDGFTTVQPAKVKRQNQAQLGHSTNVPNHTAFNRPSNAHATRPTQIDGYSNGRAAPNRGRDGAGQRGNFHNDHRGEKPANRGAPPNRASTQRAKPMSAAELASQRGEPATG